MFPKQTELVKDSETGEMNKGNFINLPYFKKTERRALNYDGTEFSFEQFIQLVESNFITAERIKEIDDELEKKCVDETLKVKVDEKGFMSLDLEFKKSNSNINECV